MFAMREDDSEVICTIGIGKGRLLSVADVLESDECFRLRGRHEEFESGVF